MRMKSGKSGYRLVMAAGLLIVAVAALVLMSACTTQSTPAGTPSGTKAEAIVATPTSAPAPVSPTQVRTPVPTAALIGTPVTSPTGPCATSPGKAFGKVYSENPNVGRPLGCAQEPEKGASMAEQTFQKGFMYWRGDIRQIYVILDAGRWVAYPDTWNEGDPSPSVGTPTPPETVEPIRGFGKVWRDGPAVRTGLGWATERERGFNGLVQPFEQGVMIGTDKGVIFVLFGSGAWLRFTDAS
ncbi:MAG: hypothetical protein Q8R28_02570 [Dehalococcoidia bacterium]|nr:hypothetical protein [Dehalococcoidia bacterium]